MNAVERAIRLYSFLTNAAALNWPLPSCSNLAPLLGMNRAQVGDALAFLVGAGMIELWHRQVTIRATGGRTA